MHIVQNCQNITTSQSFVKNCYYRKLVWMGWGHHRYHHSCANISHQQNMYNVYSLYNPANLLHFRRKGIDANVRCESLNRTLTGVIDSFAMCIARNIEHIVHTNIVHKQVHTNINTTTSASSHTNIQWNVVALLNITSKLKSQKHYQGVEESSVCNLGVVKSIKQRTWILILPQAPNAPPPTWAQLKGG